MKKNMRHIVIYRVLRVLLAPFFRHAINYRHETMENTGRPALVLANHVTNIDPILLAFAFPQQMYFVASEHTFRWGLASKVLGFLVAPIVRIKGRRGASTSKEILRTLRRGHSVCIFPEGDRTFGGRTLPFVAATGKLAKASGADLVTFRFEGGYFTWPRWAPKRRRGRMQGRIAAHYTAQRLAEMTADEVNDAIARDLYEDAYARQRETPVAYKGKRLAEFLEIALYLCPACEGFGTLHTQGDRFSCACGLCGRYTEYGFLEGAPFETVLDWDAWQQERLRAMAQSAGDGPLFKDKAQGLYEIEPRVRTTLLAEGTLHMGTQALTIESRAFPLDGISDMAISGRMTLTFAFGGKQYEVISRHPRSACKYLHLYQIAKGARE